LKGTWDFDRDPLVALREGDPAPFEAFVVDRGRAFLGFFRRLGAGSAEAEDLAQEVFLKLFRNASTYEPSGRFAAFAFRVARNAWIDRQRRRAARPRPFGAGRERQGEERPGPAPEPPSRGADPSERAERREEAARVRSALRRLPEHQRLVFELGVVQELSYREIASLLEIPEGTVKSRMFHAVRKLRELLAGREVPGGGAPGGGS